MLISISLNLNKRLNKFLNIITLYIPNLTNKRPITMVGNKLGNIFVKNIFKLAKTLFITISELVNIKSSIDNKKIN